MTSATVPRRAERRRRPNGAMRSPGRAHAGGELPPAARERIGMRPGQVNVLVRLVLRHPTRSLAKAEANGLRNVVYAALHEGDAHEWAVRRAGLERLLAPVGSDRVGVEVADLRVALRRRRGSWRRCCSGPVSRRTKA